MTPLSPRTQLLSDASAELDQTRKLCREITRDKDPYQERDFSKKPLSKEEVDVCSRIYSQVIPQKLEQVLKLSTEYPPKDETLQRAENLLQKAKRNLECDSCHKLWADRKGLIFLRIKTEPCSCCDRIKLNYTQASCVECEPDLRKSVEHRIQELAAEKCEQDSKDELVQAILRFGEKNYEKYPEIKDVPYQKNIFPNSIVDPITRIHFSNGLVGFVLKVKDLTREKICTITFRQRLIGSDFYSQNGNLLAWGLKAVYQDGEYRTQGLGSEWLYGILEPIIKGTHPGFKLVASE